MRIGFVYDLREEYRALGFSEDALAEFDIRETVDAIAAALERAGASVDFVGNGRALAARLVSGARFDLVFSIAEGVSGRNREAQVPALCEMFDQPCAFSDPLTLAVCLDKATAKRLVREAGLPTAPFALLERAEDASGVRLPVPLFVKPNAEGTGKGCGAASRVENRRSLEAVARRLIARYRQPVLVEPYLPGREFTVGILGTGEAARVLGVLELTLDPAADAGVYGIATKEGWERLIEAGLARFALARDAEAEAAAATALAAWRTLGGRDTGRIDLRSDAAGVPQFMEANPLAGLHPTHSDLPIIADLAGLGYDGLISGIIDSALGRYARPAAFRDLEAGASFSGGRPGFVPVIHASRGGRPDEEDTIATAEAVAAALVRLGHESGVIALDLDFRPLEALAARRPLAVFNLAEAIRGDAALAPLVPALLEYFRLPFTGTGAAAWRATLSKTAVKERLAAAGLPTPAWWRHDAIPAAATVIVKSDTEHASFGIDAGSVVSGTRAAAEIRAREARFGGRFFAEEFVAGREFNLAILEGECGPELLPIQEIRFDALPAGLPHIVDYAAKWDEASAAYRGTVRHCGLEAREPERARALGDLALAAWELFGLAGYARIDLRTDAAGAPFILEVNPNPCLASDAGFVAAGVEAGIGYDALISRILAAGAVRADKAPPCSASSR